MNDHGHDSEGNFYKGLFFGALIGVGLVAFLNTKTGKEVVKNVRKRVDEAFETEIIVDDYEEVNTEKFNIDAPKKSSPNRFFKKPKSK